MSSAHHPPAIAPDVGKGEERSKDDIANNLCIGIGLLLAAVTMVVPTRAPLVVDIKKGDAAAAARAMGLMSTFAAVIELIVNPVLGKLSDQYGRKPFMTFAPCVSAFLHTLVYLVPSNLPMQFIDRMISGSMIFCFLAPAQAAMADLFATDVAKLGEWGAKSGIFLGLGTTIGPFIGARVGPVRSFFLSALTFVATSSFVQLRVGETLAIENKKEFRSADINPFLFMRLLKDRMLTKLALITCFQSFGDYVNIYDINNLFMIKVLQYGPKEIGTFATVVGLSQITGGKVTKEVVKAKGLKLAALFANSLWALGMVTMGLSRNTPQAFLALFLWTFGHQRNNSVAAYMQKYGATLGMGRAEIVAATGNLLAYIKIMIPLLYSNLFAWATSKGRNMPGAPYYVICALTVLSQVVFWNADPQD